MGPWANGIPVASKVRKRRKTATNGGSIPPGPIFLF